MSLAQRAVYPSQSSSLRQLLDDLLKDAPTASEPAGRLVGLIVPDSNRLSGSEAAASAYLHLDGSEIDTVVVVSPSHNGAFGRLSICQTDVYETPLGNVAINDKLRHELCDEDDDIFLDDTGHYHAEGADVQLPFLQRILGDDFDVVPIVMGEESPAFCRELGSAIGEVLYAKKAVIVGSADLLESGPEVLERFQTALEEMNESELMHLMGSETVRVEGMGAIVTTVLAAKRRGATEARILSLTPSDDSSPGVVTVAFYRA